MKAPNPIDKNTTISFNLVKRMFTHIKLIEYKTTEVPINTFNGTTLPFMSHDKYDKYMRGEGQLKIPYICRDLFLKRRFVLFSLGKGKFSNVAMDSPYSSSLADKDYLPHVVVRYYQHNVFSVRPSLI